MRSLLRRFAGHFASDGSAPARLRGDDGATILEFALILPFFAFFTFGLIDFGNAYRQENLLEVGVMSAARTNTQLAINRFADYETLRSLSSTFNSMGSSVKMTKVIIWKANTATTPPASCTGIAVSPTGTNAKGVSGLCNVYSWAQVETSNPSGFPAGSSTSQSCTGGWDANWCPVGGGRTNADGNGDYLGVYVEMTYTPLTKIVLSNPITISEQAIYRLEPPYVGGT